MRLYVNGDSHTAAAEAVNPHAFAEDDSQYFYLGRAPHPGNFAVSWATRLSELLKAPLHCDAESASSNHRIIRTTREWIQNHPGSLSQSLFIIQWSTWERQEWLHNGTYYQLNASGIDHVPDELVEKYKQFVTNVNWPQCQNQAHDDIWQFHCELNDLGIRHIFFNGNNHFETQPNHFDWGSSYLAPYDSKMTFHNQLISSGFATVNPKSWHFGADAHSFFARSMLKYIVNNNFI